MLALKFVPDVTVKQELLSYLKVSFQARNATISTENIILGMAPTLSPASRAAK